MVFRAAALVCLPVVACALPGASAWGATTPAQSQVLANGTAVTGECAREDGQVTSRLRYWSATTVDPARIHGGPRGDVLLAPKAEELPRAAQIPMIPPLLWFASPQGSAFPAESGGCAVNATSSDAAQAGDAVELRRPGPYVFEQYDQTTHFVAVPDTFPPTADPEPQPCAENDALLPAPMPIPVALPPSQAGSHWAIDTYCNRTTVTGFYVKGAAGDCPTSADMSGWPAAPYISQYDAGARLGLPLGESRLGGNACGPSSLLMAMLGSAGPAGLPTLNTVFDATMARTSSEVAPNGQNVFLALAKAVPYLKSLGWTQARTVGLPATTEAVMVTNATLIAQALAKGPVVLSTAFGAGRWGVSGGGHVIEVVGQDDGGWVVNDPAGNFFSTPKTGYSNSSGGHYGPGSCGNGVVYPYNWVLAYTAGRWLLELGPRTAPVPTVRTRGAGPRTVRSRSALAVYDTHPGDADAPRSFYLEDPSGRRAGWIDGHVIEEIPDAAVGQDPPGWTDPGVGDPDIDPTPSDPPATPRALVVPDPQPGTTLHVAADAGASFALTTDTWTDGALAASDALTGTGTGAAVVVASPALVARPAPATTPPVSPPTTSGSGPQTAARLTAGKVRVRRRAVSVTLTCAGAATSSCRFVVALTTKQRRRTVTIARATARLAGGRKLTVVLKPGANGRRLLAGHPTLTASLAVTHVREGTPTATVLRRRLRI